MRPIPLLAEAGSLRRRVRRSKKVTVSRRALVAAGAVAGLLVAWSGASLWYMVSRDEVTLKLLERQATIKRGYEDKLVALRSRLDQVTTQRLVEHETLRGRIETLLARQAAFEARQSNAQPSSSGPAPCRSRRGTSSATSARASAPTRRDPARPPRPVRAAAESAPRAGAAAPDSLDGTILSLDLAAARLDALEAARTRFSRPWSPARPASAAASKPPCAGPASSPASPRHRAPAARSSRPARPTIRWSNGRRRASCGLSSCAGRWPRCRSATPSRARSTCRAASATGSTRSPGRPRCIPGSTSGPSRAPRSAPPDAAG